jgi:hypothetical protein
LTLVGFSIFIFWAFSLSVLPIPSFSEGGFSTIGFTVFLFHNLQDKYSEADKAKIKNALVPKGQAEGKES